MGNADGKLHESLGKVAISERRLDERSVGLRNKSGDGSLTLRLSCRVTNCEAEGKLDPRAGILLDSKPFISPRRQWRHFNHSRRPINHLLPLLNVLNHEDKTTGETISQLQLQLCHLLRSSHDVLYPEHSYKRWTASISCANRWHASIRNSAPSSGSTCSYTQTHSRATAERGALGQGKQPVRVYARGTAEKRA